MSKTLSRRDFLKSAAAGVAGIAAMGVLGACSSADATTAAATEAPTTATEPGTTAQAPAETTAARTGTYIPGTYSATAQGIGTVMVTMTFDEENITDVTLDVSGETAGANYGQAAAEPLREALMTAQSAEIDGVAGATLTSNAVKQAAAKCIAQAKGEIPVEALPTPGGETETAAGWLGTEPEVAEADIAETWDTGILIIGAGNGGMCAAAYAAKKGLSFRVIEKGTAPARVRGWYGAIDSEDAAAANEPPVDRAALRNELKRYSSGKCNLRIWNTWINESAAMHKFIKDCYAQYLPDAKVEVTAGTEAVWPEAQGFYFPVCEHFWGFGEVDRQTIFRKIVEEEAGVAIDFQTALVKLEKNGDRVTGAIAQNLESGAYIRINASQGVLLAAGGYPHNSAMMEQLDPMGTAVTTSNVSWPTDTGDGIKAAKWIGAAMQAEAAPMLFDRGIVPPGMDAGYQTLSNGDKAFPATEGQFNLGSQPFLKVNRHGLRFTNESGTYDMMPYAAYNQPGHVYASIFDANMPEDVQRFHTLGCSAGTRKNPQGQLDAFEKQIEKGNAFKADTLEELADLMGFSGVSKENFLATCARYNELFDKQDDEDFGKPAYRLSALKTAPFYGFWMGACILTTEQGILCNENAQVIDEAGEPIEGLFVCGDNAGGFFVDNYPCLMPGVAMGRNMTFAIKAIKIASGEEA
ncbi:MAG: FAD-binding protein [Lachnospiraceae bacterium]|nr:FAD-binding protein [Lachnospiraceae bacterium]